MINEFLAVYHNASYRVYESKEQALITKPLFVAETYVHSSFPIWSDPERNKYSFEIVDVNNKPYQINCDGWRIVSIIKYFLYNSHTEIKIAAPDGEIRMIDTEDSWNSLESISKLLTFINQFSGYKDWNYYELQQENIRLINENESLKKELEELRYQ
jgi:hypothetical protein